jgi:hypothetical protein
MTTIDRSAVSRALAKAIAYKQCGKDQLAEAWAAELVRLLGAACIISDDYLKFASDRALIVAPAEAWGGRWGGPLQ